MNKLLICGCAALSLLSNTANADFLGLYVGGGSWSHDPSGGFQSQDPGSDNISMKDTLGLNDESEGYLYIAFDHPVPFLPNIRLEKTALTHNGVSSGVNFNGVNALSGNAVVSLDSTDLTLYWRLLDNWVNLDVGLTLRKFDGEFTIASESLALQETIPMIYAAAQFDLPLTGLSVGGDINVISLSGNSLTDTRLRLLYEIGVVGVEAGLRSTKIELDDVDNITTNITFDGLFLGAFLHF
jgi:outer membrane protein